MQVSIKSVLLAVIGTLTLVHASPTGADGLLSREAIPEPKADCCSCDLENRGAGNYICRVPKKGICVVPAIACPHDPVTQELCCCCDPKVPATRCQAVPKGSGCICTAVKCPFQFDPSFLPVSSL
ncbi:hypothetical protein CORC01_10074 [Colletotrichum orchidophilum]|uniref:Uncharacterized protein n=1 Tax=Colletotrichum orchidophilum TaxID=1209926 RepID=A0A1G4B016_9PEZI|nr:uncharacterized protein CORC01_10074 [Colletotrichum orchidophilum]OHE94673.1 hypothetical protein CORC01_10074 [Colletotrichum orchidophilum]